MISLTWSLHFCSVSSTAEQLLSSLGLTFGLSHRGGLLRATIWTHVLFLPPLRRLILLVAVLLLRRALSLPLAVELPGREGGHGVLGQSEHHLANQPELT